MESISEWKPVSIQFYLWDSSNLYGSRRKPNDISDSSVTCIIYLTVTDNDGNTDMGQLTVTGLLNDGGQQLKLSDASNTTDKLK